jgi:hypothetical protein
MNTDFTETKAIYARVRAINPKDPPALAIPFLMYAGTWVGMSLSPMPSWSIYDKTSFSSKAEAEHHVSFLPAGGYEYEIIPDTIEYVEVTTVTIRVVNERTL